MNRIEDLIGNKKPIVITGASKLSFDENSSEEKVKQFAEEYLSKLDPKKVILITGGTDHGVEKIFHEIAKQKGIQVVGFTSSETIPSELNKNLKGVYIDGRNWDSPLQRSMDVAKKFGGEVVAIGGGGVVKRGLDYGEKIAVPMHVSRDVDGASKEYAIKNPANGFATALDIQKNQQFQKSSTAWSAIVIGFPNTDLSLMQKGGKQFFLQNPSPAPSAHLILNEGDSESLKQMLDYVLSKHDSKKQALIHLSIGSEPENKIGDKGVRAASFFAKFLAQNSELIGEFKKIGINFMVYDVKSSRHYSNLSDYYKSIDWKTELNKFAAARAEVNTNEFKNKKASAKYPSISGSEIKLTENRVNPEAIISTALSVILKNDNKERLLADKIIRTLSSSTESHARRKAGVTVDPIEAAKSAAKGTK